MYRILSIILSVFLTMNSIMLTVNAEDSVKETNIPSHISELLSSIGITRTEDNLLLDSQITRAEFAVFAHRLIGESGKEKSNQYYNDVKKGDYCFEAVSTLVQMGALSVGEERMFLPDRGIGYEEVCKILIHLLGYGDLAVIRGGYPSGYVSTAHSLDLDDGISVTEMTYKNVVRMLYNATKVDLTEVSGISHEGHIIRNQNEETILSLYHDIYKAEGMVEKNSVVSVVDNTICRDGVIGIGESYIDASGSDLDMLLGVEVVAYYKKTANEETGKLVYYHKKIRDSFIIDAEDLIGYSKGVLSYYDSTKEKKINIGTEAVILKNGLPVRENETKAFDVDYGYVEIFENHTSGSFAAHIYSSETWYVKYTNTYEKVIYDEYRGKENLDCDANCVESLKVIDVSTKMELSFDYIKIGHILTVFRSENDKIIRIYVNNAKLTGTVNSVSKNDYTVKIDNAEYKINRELAEKIPFVLGLNATFLLDMNGKVCACVPTADRTLYGYLYGIAEPEGFGKGKVKVFTVTGEHRELMLADKINIDGVSVNSHNGVVSKLMASGDMGTIKQLIRFNTNSNGEVNRIDTATRNENGREKVDTLYMTVPYDGGTTQYYYTSNSEKGCFFVPKPTMYRDTVVFVVPDESIENPEENRFMVTNKSFFSKSGAYKISAYKTDLTHPYTEAIVVRSDAVSTITDGNDIFLVDEILEVAKEDGTTGIVLKGMERGYVKEVFVADNVIDPEGLTVDELERGDIIRYAVDHNKEICIWEKLYDCGTNATIGWSKTLNNANSYLHLIHAYVIDKYMWREFDDKRYEDADIPLDILYLGYEDSVNISREFRITLTSLVVQVYDKEKDIIYTGSAEDIVGYKNSNEGSSVIIQDAYGITKAIILYK